MQPRTVSLCARDLEPLALADARTLPAHVYTDPAVHDLDLREVLAPAWQFVAHESEIAAPGDYLVRNIAGAPVLLVHGQDGARRAFYNVCRHRAGPVAAGAGNCRLLRCRYHGWVYGLDGALQHAPELGEIAGFDEREHSLRQFDLLCAGPLLFVRPRAASADGDTDIDLAMRAIDARSGPGMIGRQRYAHAESYEIACNWKVYVDNYLEGYHIPRVHPALAKILDYRDYATETHEEWSLQYGRIAQDTGAYGVGEALYFFVFPNLMLNVLPGRLQTNLVVPVAPDRCRVDFVYYYAEGTDPARVQADVAFGDLVQREDIEICEQVQQGLQSGAYEGGRLSVAREQCVHHFHERYKGWLRNRLRTSLP